MPNRKGNKNLNKRRSQPRRLGREDIVDCISLNLPAGTTVHYLQSDIPVDVGRRSYKIVSASCYISSAVPTVAQLRLLDPAYEQGEQTIASSSPIAVANVPQNIRVRMPRNIDPVPAGRAGNQKLIGIDHVCVEKNTSTARIIGTLRVVISFSREFMSEACPTRVIGQYRTTPPGSAASTSLSIVSLPLEHERSKECPF